MTTTFSTFGARLVAEMSKGIPLLCDVKLNTAHSILKPIIMIIGNLSDLLNVIKSQFYWRIECTRNDPFKLDPRPFILAPAPS